MHAPLTARPLPPTVIRLLYALCEQVPKAWSRAWGDGVSWFTDSVTSL